MYVLFAAIDIRSCLIGLNNNQMARRVGGYVRILGRKVVSPAMLCLNPRTSGSEQIETFLNGRYKINSLSA